MVCFFRNIKSLTGQMKEEKNRQKDELN